MLEPTTNNQGFLEMPLLGRLRRNHGLEHSTLHMLAERHPGKPIAGHSDAGGYWIIGDLSTEEVLQAAQEALTRLKAGERKLAVHPNCGTNFATAGVLTGIAAGLAMFGVGRKPRDNFERLPTAILFATLALMIAHPLGLAIQEQITTSADPGELYIVDVQPVRKGKLTIHRIITGD